ncbi:GH3 auxin-responsive promoter family protein [bacterium]|nr:GH3 auxin-responsive promoter family protein [bacterium]
MEELGAATGPWIASLLGAFPALRSGSSYWSISPVARREERTPGGARVGFEDDREYFPPLVRRALGVLLPVPPGVARLPDIESCRHATLRYLLADRHLALISVWNPSFLVLLLEHARAHGEALANDIERGTLALDPGLARASGLRPLPPDPARARVVRDALARGLDLERLWPDLALVSCWTDAAASLALPSLVNLLPARVAIQGKGLLATEGVVSFPIPGGEGSVLAVGSHLLELFPEGDSGECAIPCSRAELGGRYRPILTTGGGLYRYDLGDIVEVVGRFRRTPRVRFVGRADGVSDLRGEKLSPARVGEVLARALARNRVEARFALVAPLLDETPAYALLIDSDSQDAALESTAQGMEDDLREAHAYDHARVLGQLDALRVVRVRDGARRFEQALVSRGAKAGNVKPASLHAGLFWPSVFPEARAAAGRAVAAGAAP